MSLNMYLGEVQAQTESMNASCNAIIESMEQVIQSIDSFVGDAVLQGKTYDSAKMFFLQTFRPLAQGIIYLCEELIHQNNAFPADFQAEVATVDVIEQEILEQIRELERMIAEVQSMSAHMSGMDALLQVYYAMKRKLEDKLERLYQFNVSSSDNYATAMMLAADVAKGLAEVQSGKGFSPASGTFSTKELNMDWATSIQAIAEERNRLAEELKGDTSSEKSLLEKIGDGIYDGTGQAVGDTIEGIKALGDLETWKNMGNAIVNYDETLPAMWNTLSDSFINDVINGDAESRAKWGSYALTQVGLGLIGDKGLSKLSKGGTFAKGASSIKDSDLHSATLNKLRNQTGNRFVLVGIDETALKYDFGDTYKEAKDLLSEFAVSKEEYKFLRKRTPNDKIRKSVNRDEIPKVDPVYGYEVEKLEADHILSAKNVTDMEGFDQLPRKDQIEILNMEINFIGLGKSTNASKGAKDWETWSGHPKYGEIPEKIRLEMLEREQIARKAIQEAINERLKLLENNN